MSRYSVPADGVQLHAAISKALMYDPLRPKMVHLILEAKAQNYRGHHMKIILIVPSMQFCCVLWSGPSQQHAYRCI